MNSLESPETCTMTANELDAAASDCAARNAKRVEQQLDVEDSALSAWSDGLNRRLYTTLADIKRQGGMSLFPALYDLTGRRVRSKLIDSKFGRCWAFLTPDLRLTGRFVPFMGNPICERVMSGEAEQPCAVCSYCRTEARKRDRLLKKGFVEGLESAPAWARVHGTGRGPSGCHTCRVVVYRTDGGCPKI